jgi:hypothetical protein
MTDSLIPIIKCNKCFSLYSPAIRIGPKAIIIGGEGKIITNCPNIRCKFQNKVTWNRLKFIPEFVLNDILRTSSSSETLKALYDSLKVLGQTDNVDAVQKELDKSFKQVKVLDLMEKLGLSLGEIIMILLVILQIMMASSKSDETTQNKIKSLEEKQEIILKHIANKILGKKQELPKKK